MEADAAAAEDEAETAATMGETDTGMTDAEGDGSIPPTQALIGLDVSASASSSF